MFFKKIAKKILVILCYLMRVFPLNNNRILISSFSARSYSDNPKYIVEEMIRQNMHYDFIVVLRSFDKNIPKGVRYVKYNTLMYLYYVCTSKVWIDNTRKQDFIRKRKNQFYLQTWHGAIALKKIEKDAIEVLNSKYIETARNDSKMIDLIISNSTFSDRLFKESFWYKGDIFKCGSPRNDVLFENAFHTEEKIKTKYNINKKRKLVLYAPTFRNHQDYSVYNFNIEKLLLTLKEKFNEEYVLLLRLHPNIKDKQIFAYNSHNIIDVSQYPDVSELMLVSDILITDYSSLMFEFGLASPKPVFLYSTDVDLYERGFYFKLDDLPFDLAKSTDELLENIQNFNPQLYQKRVEQFYSDIDLLEDGKASSRIAYYLNRILQGKGDFI